ncbi:MAG: PAS domain S-box protein [Anaeromyxobacteraceae bacterium]
MPYAQVIAEMLDGVLVATSEARVVAANAAAARIFEVPGEELLVPLAVYPERFALRALDGHPELPVAQRALAGEIVAPVEQRIRTATGDKIIRTSAAPLRDEDGVVIGAVVLAADVSAMKAEEQRARQEVALLQQASEDRQRALDDARKTAELLRVTESRFAAFVKATSEAIYLMSPDWTEMRFLSGGGFLVDTSAPHLRWDERYLLPEDRPAVWRVIHEAIARKRPFHLEHRVVRQDGSIGWTLSRAVPSRDGQGRVVEWFGIASDITPRKRAEEAALEGERRLRAFFQSVMELAGVHEAVRDASGAVVDSIVREVNDPALQLLGRGREEVVGRRLSEVFTPELASALTRPWAEVLATGAPARYEVEVAGHVLAVAASRMGAATIAAVADDITERKRAERALRESELQFRTLTEAMPHIVCALAPDGRAEYVNPQWTAFSGLDLPSTNRVGWGALLHPDDLAAAADCRRRALKTLAPQETELRYRRADGAFRWFLSRLAPIVDDRRVVRFIGSAMDIEDRKRAEEALRETDRRRTEFLGVLSHELRNPLAPIRNGIEILDKVPEGARAARAREVIRRQAGQLTRLVDDLLDATRISRGKVHLQREVTDLQDLVRKACEDSRSVFADANLELSLEIPAGPVWADVDPTRISQVIGNLLHNAHKFTQPGGAVTVRLRVRGGRAEVSVRDDGVGIAPAQLSRMFEPFAQEDRSLARTQGGLGLGLALAKGLVELHGGTIEARSEGAGKGSEFKVWLPVIEAKPAPPPRPPDRSHGAARLRVLVIDDNADAAQTLADALELEGHEVTVARNGTVGLRLARELQPDLVLCDLGLPDLDGYEVARRLRADDALRYTRLIAVSGYAQPEDIERAREAGFDVHLPKPAPLEELSSLLAGQPPPA